MPHVLVWDIETVPDLSGFAAANDLFDIILCQSCLASPNAEYMSGFRSFIQKMEVVMAQASVLTDAEMRRLFRIIDTTRHVERNRLAFVLSIFAGLRVGEIAALTVGDVATANGDVRREIKLGAHQTIATQQPSFSPM